MALYKIKEFPQDGAFWRIDWIGKARPNIDVETEPSLLIHLSKLKPGYRDSLSNGSLTDDQVTKTVGLGLLPLLPAGSVWKDGRLHAHIPPNKREVFEIDTSQEVSQAFNGKIRVGGNDSDVIPFWHYPVRKHYPALQDAPLAVFPAIKGTCRYCAATPRARQRHWCRPLARACALLLCRHPPAKSSWRCCSW